MRHWEVLELLDNFNRQQAKFVLNMADAVALGSGTISDESKQKEVYKKYQDESYPPRAKARMEEEKGDSAPWTAFLQEFT